MTCTIDITAIIIVKIASITDAAKKKNDGVQKFRKKTNIGCGKIGVNMTVGVKLS